QVRDAAAGPSARTPLLNHWSGVDECLGVAVVLGDARRHGEHVRVEDDVLRGEPDLGHEQVVRPTADLDLALDRIGLALLVEGHDDYARAVVSDRAGLPGERLLALLEADRVDDSLALQALQAGLQHAPP